MPNREELIGKISAIALDSWKLNEACIKRKATMPNMEELISQISAKITKSGGEIWMSKIDLEYVTERRNYPNKRQNTVYFQSLEATSRDITDSRKASTVCLKYPYRKNTWTKYWNSKHLSG